MKLAFSKNPRLIGSLLIQWGMADGFFELAPVSHFIVIFDEKLVFESNLSKGVHVCSLRDFLDGHNEIAYSFRLKNDLTLEQEEAIYQSVVKQCVGKSYDLSALFYLGWRVFLKKFFNKPIPEDNEWNWNEQFFCVETILPICEAIKETTGISLFPNLESDMLDPMRLCELMKQNQNLEIEYGRP